MPSVTAKSSKTAAPEAGEPKDRSKQNSVYNNLLLILIAFRLANVLAVQTFFQPDEYYQSLEPAWWLAFGASGGGSSSGGSSGAWITWEWKNQLRSAFHPALFAGVYSLADAFSNALRISPPVRSQVLLIAPKTLQALIAALADYYTYKLSAHIYGPSSTAAWCTIWLSAGSAWNWFVSTRTFSNCLETTLTIIALYNWPFHWALGADEVPLQVDENTLRIRQPHPHDKGRVEGEGGAEKESVDIDESTRLRRCILAASLAVILRPTNAIIWVTVVFATLGRGIWHHAIHWEMGAFIREGLLCGSTVLALTALVDRVFYGVWTFPVWHFFKFNILQSLAVFYGNNNWNYYLLQGYPLLLTAAIVPAGIGLFSALVGRHGPPALSIQSRLILHRLAVVSIVLPTALSVLSHKEVRFIYPVLPALHILAALPLSRMLGYPNAVGDARFSQTRGIRSRALVILLAILNIIIAFYTSRIHNSGIIAVTNYLRTEFESQYLIPSHAQLTKVADRSPTHGKNLTFAVLMPCHSIPWRSHLQYPPMDYTPGISGWALTCEPPLNLNATQKETYMDEADIFYANPAAWLKTHMSRDVPKGSLKPGLYATQPDKKLWSSNSPRPGVFLNEGEGWQANSSASSDVSSLQPRKPYSEKRGWPDYLLFFGQLEPLMSRVLDGSQYSECARFFNSHFHDDWRRTGDVVVWCLYPERQHKNTGVNFKKEEL